MCACDAHMSSCTLWHATRNLKRTTLARRKMRLQPHTRALPGCLCGIAAKGSHRRHEASAPSLPGCLCAWRKAFAHAVLSVEASATMVLEEARTLGERVPAHGRVGLCLFVRSCLLRQLCLGWGHGWGLWDGHCLCGWCLCSRCLCGWGLWDGPCLCGWCLGWGRCNGRRC